jgi:ketosteroid isomerase-like protein
MTSTNLEVARAYFQALQNGDLATVGELLHDEVVWHQPGANQFSGVRKGKSAVFDMLGAMMQTSNGSFAVDKVHAFMANGDLVTVTIHFAANRQDASMSMDGVDLLRIEDGKITEMWLFSSDPESEDAFWGR